MIRTDDMADNAAEQRSSAVVAAGLTLLYTLIVGKFIFAPTAAHSGPAIGSFGWWILALIGLTSVFVSFGLVVQRCVRAHYYGRQAQSNKVNV